MRCTMPFFGSKFSPKKTPSRKQGIANEPVEELYGENRTITVKLSEQECLFENGEWVPDNGKNGALQKHSQKLKRQIQELQEENNMLRLKYELMLNMLTQTTAESHVQQREIEKLRKVDGRKRHK